MKRLGHAALVALAALALTAPSAAVASHKRVSHKHAVKHVAPKSTFDKDRDGDSSGHDYDRDGR